MINWYVQVREEELSIMKSLIILINKLIYMIGKMIGRGSTLPGQVALKLDKNILKKVTLPDDVIVVTGSSR